MSSAADLQKLWGDPNSLHLWHGHKKGWMLWMLWDGWANKHGTNYYPFSEAGGMMLNFNFLGILPWIVKISWGNS